MDMRREFCASTNEDTMTLVGRQYYLLPYYIDGLFFRGDDICNEFQCSNSNATATDL